MTYKELYNMATDAQVSLNAFFASAQIFPKEQKKIIEEDFVPSYLWLMFKHYLENIQKQRYFDEEFNNKKDDFLKRAVSKGYKVSNGFVTINTCDDRAKPIEINEFESQFVKYAMFKGEDIGK